MTQKPTTQILSHSEIIERIQKSMLKEGKKSLIHKIMKNTTKTHYILTKKSNPYLEASRTPITIIKKRKRGLTSSVLISRKNGNQSITERILLSTPTIKLE